MSKIKLLTKRQLEVIEDLFEAEKKESEILQKHNLSRIVYNKWLEERNFIEEFDRVLLDLNTELHATSETQ